MKPPGILPKNAQTWVIAGLATVMVAAIALSGNGSKSKMPAPTSRPGAVIDPERIADRRIPQSAGGRDPETGGRAGGVEPGETGGGRFGPARCCCDAARWRAQHLRCPTAASSRRPSISQETARSRARAQGIQFAIRLQRCAYIPEGRARRQDATKSAATAHRRFQRPRLIHIYIQFRQSPRRPQSGQPRESRPQPTRLRCALPRRKTRSRPKSSVLIQSPIPN